VKTEVSLFAVIDSWRQWRSAMMTTPCHNVRLSQEHGASSWWTRLGLRSAVCSRFSYTLRPVPRLSTV